MARNLKALAQHTLPFENRKEFLKELSKRFQANVYLGFLEHYGLAQNDLLTFKSRGLINPFDDDYLGELYLLDEVQFSTDAPPFLLIINDYLYKWLHYKYGEKAGYLKEFIKDWGNDAITNNLTIKSFIEQPTIIDFFYQDMSGLFSLESASVVYKEYFTDWTNFFYLITQQDKNFTLDFYKGLLEYRNANRLTVLKLGGNCIFYQDGHEKTWELRIKEMNGI